MTVGVTFDPPRAAASHPLRGVGAQFNTNLFTHEGEETPLSEDELETLRATIEKLHLGHSRIFVRPGARKPGPQRTALLKTIKLAEQAGADVNLTWWQGPFPHEPQRDHAKRRKRLMDDFAGIVREARATDGVSCLTHLTVMNEVNSYDIAKQLKPRKTMELYEALYRDLHESLSGMADRPLLIGGDLVESGPGHVLVKKQKFRYGPSNQDDWLAFMREHMADVLDGYSIHVYWKPDEFPQKIQTRLGNLASLGIKKPLYVTEYGVRQLTRPRPGTFDGTKNGTKMEQAPQCAFMHAWFNALALQHGCVGMSKWVLYRTSKRAEFGEWGMIGPARGQPAPFHPSPICEITRIFNILIGDGWTADGFGPRGSASLLASRFKGPAGGQSVVVLNNASAQRVQLNGLKKNTRFNVLTWQHDGHTATTRRLPAKASTAGGAVTVDLPGHGLVALSTLPLA